MQLLGLCLQPDDPDQLGVGADASGWDGIKHKQVKHMKLHKAWRVQSEQLWQQYVAQRQRVIQDLKHVPSNVRAQWPDLALRKAFAGITSLLPGELNGDANEQYLMSGVPKETVLKVLMGGMLSLIHI